jgi:hypothetical protein
MPTSRSRSADGAIRMASHATPTALIPSPTADTANAGSRRRSTGLAVTGEKADACQRRLTARPAPATSATTGCDAGRSSALEVKGAAVGRAGLGIGELAERVHLRPSALRYYEQAGLIPPPAAGQRRDPPLPPSPSGAL